MPFTTRRIRTGNTSGSIDALRSLGGHQERRVCKAGIKNGGFDTDDTDSTEEA